MNKFFNTIVLVAFTTFSFSSWALDCEGRFDFHDDYEPVHKKVSLLKTIDTTAFEMYEGQIENFHYSVTLYKDGNYKMGIYIGPEYTTGTLVTGSLLEDSRHRLSFVKEQRSLNVICK
ncbi:MAG: hypothetical protein KC493_07160 [Bacteriovoracaceae bacterium]|nr:hypothetical protein [Bacteriovoracaceae bacterium]